MFSLERWNEIFEAIRKNKLRTFLTGLSVASGIFILMVLLGVGNGMRNGVKEAFAGDAMGAFFLWTNLTSKSYNGLGVGRKIQLTSEDYNLVVSENNSNLELKGQVVHNGTSLISYKGKFSSYRTEGIQKDVFDIEGCKLYEGRFFNHQDAKERRKVVVIGKTICDELFQDKSPVGEEVKINNIPFVVVGVFTDSNPRDENKIYTPFKLTRQVFGFGQNINNMSFTIAPQKDLDEYLKVAKGVYKNMKDALRLKHSIAPDDERAIRINEDLEEAKKVFTMLDMIQLFFWVVGICTIVAGVVGVANIMFIIVKERTKEIGIRKALGAKPSSIIFMILHESIFITAMAGLIGLILGLFMWEIVSPYIQSDYFKNPSVDFNMAILSVIILIISGGLAGFFPAYRAAKIKPIDTLRDE